MFDNDVECNENDDITEEKCNDEVRETSMITDSLHFDQQMKTKIDENIDLLRAISPDKHYPDNGN